MHGLRSKKLKMDITLTSFGKKLKWGVFFYEKTKGIFWYEVKKFVKKKISYLFFNQNDCQNLIFVKCIYVVGEKTYSFVIFVSDHKFLVLAKNHNQISQFWACILIKINFMVIFMNLCKTIGIFGLYFRYIIWSCSNLFY